MEKKTLSQKGRAGIYILVDEWLEENTEETGEGFGRDGGGTAIKELS